MKLARAGEHRRMRMPVANLVRARDNHFHVHQALE